MERRAPVSALNSQRSRTGSLRLDKPGLPQKRCFTHATLALAAGIHPKVVSERLGHSKVALTLDVYSHAIPAMEEEAALRIAALVTG